MSPLVGYSRFRKHQFGKQSVVNTAVAATRRVGWRGVPDIDPQWTDQEEVDTGSIDPTLPAYRTWLNVALPFTINPLTFDDIPLIMAAGLRGGVSGSAGGGGSYTWAHESLSLSPTTLDLFTDEFSDDATLTDSALEDGMQLYGGIVESFDLGFDEELGPLTGSANWRFSGVNPHVTPTTGLQVSSNLPQVFGADSAVYVDDTSGGIGGTLISNALHGFTLSIENEVDRKQFANGSNSRFQVNGWGLAGRTITATFRFAKTAAIVQALDSETVDWLNATPTERYVKLLTQSTQEAESGVPYSWDQRFSGTWRTRSEAEVGGNDIVELEMKGRYDAGLAYAYRSSVVNTLAALP